LPAATHPRQVLAPGVVRRRLDCLRCHEQVTQRVDEIQNRHEIAEVFLPDRPVPRQAVTEKGLCRRFVKPPAFQFAEESFPRELLLGNFEGFLDVIIEDFDFHSSRLSTFPGDACIGFFLVPT